MNTSQPVTTTANTVNGTASISGTVAAPEGVVSLRLTDFALAPPVEKGPTPLGAEISANWRNGRVALTLKLDSQGSGVGLGLSIAGGLAGGWYVDRAGIFKGLWVLGLAQALSNLGYAAAAWVVPQALPGTEVSASHQMVVYAASALESFTGGLGTGAFLAFLMGITDKRRATTEYAILSSIFAFSRAVAGWAGGLGVEQMGYAAFFLLTFFLSFPAYALLPAVRRMLMRDDVR